jgi:hypothetical protein
MTVELRPDRRRWICAARYDLLRPLLLWWLAAAFIDEGMDLGAATYSSLNTWSVELLDEGAVRAVHLYVPAGLAEPYAVDVCGAHHRGEPDSMVCFEWLCRGTTLHRQPPEQVLRMLVEDVP